MFANPKPQAKANPCRAFPPRQRLTFVVDHLTPIVMEAELLAVLLSIPAKVAWPDVLIDPTELNVTFTVTMMA